MHDFNVLYPGYITVPAHCQKTPVPIPKPKPSPTPPPPPPAPPPPPPVPLPGTDSPPIEDIPGPITGEPPPEECGEGYYIPRPTIGIPEGPPITGIGGGTGIGGFGSGGSGNGARSNSRLLTMDEQIKEDTQPLVAGMTPVYLLDGSTDDPQYTQQPYFQVRTGSEQAIMDAIHEGTGTGNILLHPPEFQDYMLHGNDQNGDSKWPTSISETGLMLHNSIRADGTTGDNAVSYFSLGIPLTSTVKPGSGWYAGLDLATGDLCWRETDGNGLDVDTAVMKVNGNPVQTYELQVVEEGTSPSAGASYTVVHGKDTGGASFTVTLPDTTTVDGHTYRIVNDGTAGRTVTVAVFVGDILLGTTDDSFILNDGESIILTANGTDGRWA